MDLGYISSCLEFFIVYNDRCIHFLTVSVMRCLLPAFPFHSRISI